MVTLYTFLKGLLLKIMKQFNTINRCCCCCCWPSHLPATVTIRPCTWCRVCRRQCWSLWCVWLADPKTLWTSWIWCWCRGDLSTETWRWRWPQRTWNPPTRVRIWSRLKTLYKTPQRLITWVCIGIAGNAGIHVPTAIRCVINTARIDAKLVCVYRTSFAWTRYCLYFARVDDDEREFT